MKYFSLFILFALTNFLSFAQPFIHAHNDYHPPEHSSARAGKPELLTNALRNKVFSVEADIYLSGNRLLVAHDKNDPDSYREPTAKTLDSLYLQPIINLFRQHGGTISADKNYTTTLTIDIKESLLSSGGEAVIAELIKLLAPHRSVFDRTVNAKAVQVVISGNRGSVSKWVSYPSYIFFDGRPKEVYDSATLQRVAFISDSYFNYINPPDSCNSRIEQLAKKIHGMGKLLRVWAYPDNAESWKLQQQPGIDIINTDKVAECRSYFQPVENR